MAGSAASSLSSVCIGANLSEPCLGQYAVCDVLCDRLALNTHAQKFYVKGSEVNGTLCGDWIQGRS